MAEVAAVDVVIRPRTDEDFDALVALDWSSAVHHSKTDPKAYQLPDREASIDFLRRRLADPAREVLVAVADGTVIGMVEVTIVDEARAGSIHRPIRTADLGISILEGWRRQGIGRRLMAAAEESARRRGADRMILDMSAANAGALAFYRALGYVDHELVLRRTLG